jgi:hypothetical protein
LHSDFRLVAATRKPLLEMMRDGRLRRDLYYRISVFPSDGFPENTWPKLVERPRCRVERLTFCINQPLGQPQPAFVPGQATCRA